MASATAGRCSRVQPQGRRSWIIVFSGNLRSRSCSAQSLLRWRHLPPLWGLGFWHRVCTDHAEVRAEVDTFAEECPLDVIGLEPGWMSQSYPCSFEWQLERFPDPKAFTHELLDQGIRLNLWENPTSRSIAASTKTCPLSGSHMVWLGIVPDYTLPKRASY